MTDPQRPTATELARLASAIPGWAQELGFQQVGITDTDLSAVAPDVRQWLAEGRHGSMQWLTRNVDKRIQPALLHAGTIRVISLRMDYLPAAPLDNDPDHPAIARYALGRDYHKLIRKRLAQLAARIRDTAGPLSQRPFVDSAPVLEKPLAVKAGLGWQGRNTLLLNRTAGSWFFLGEIYTSLPLPVDTPYQENHCGSCTACVEACPTAALNTQGQIDARRCIAYLTIEHHGSIDPSLRPLVGNRIFGCDDCQTSCPWNRRATATAEAGFEPRPDWQTRPLRELFGWSEERYLQATEGSPLRRLGYPRWLRNLAVALGNARPGPENLAALRMRQTEADPVVREHVAWAIGRQEAAGLEQNPSATGQGTMKCSR